MNVQLSKIDWMVESSGALIMDAVCLFIVATVEGDSSLVSSFVGIRGICRRVVCR